MKRPISRGVAICLAVAMLTGLAACSAQSSASGPPTTAPPASAAAIPSPSVAPSPSEAPTANPAEVVEDAPYRPEIDPSEFTTTITNSYMPLVPGTVLTYQGEGERVETTVTDQTRMVMGVETVVIRDRAFEGDALIEDTFDWFAQDTIGNVWYFGEDTAECEDGAIASREGAWEAGVDGAQPGVVMLAVPTIGEFYRQEFFRGEAEDVARVLDIDATVKHRKATYRDVVVTEDFTALEPGRVEHKMYAPTIGLVEDRLVKGGEGVLRLIDVQTGLAPGSMPAGKLCRS